MTIIKILIISGFCFFSLIMLLVVIAGYKKNGEILGKPTVAVWWFITGKLSLFVCLFLYIYTVIKSGYSYTLIPKFNDWISLIVFFPGIVFLSAGFLNLGRSLRMGLPNNSTKLMTKGIFKITRNPVYVGLNLICLSSAIYFSHPINILLMFVVWVYHHQVIISEEGFLKKRFGSAWLNYTKKTRRYI